MLYSTCRAGGEGPDGRHGQEGWGRKPDWSPAPGHSLTPGALPPTQTCVVLPEQRV